MDSQFYYPSTGTKQRTLRMRRLNFPQNSNENGDGVKDMGPIKRIKQIFW